MSRNISKIISIDAFNTLFVPKKPVLRLYYEAGLKYGVNLNEEQLSKKFPKGVYTVFKLTKNS